MTGATDAPVTTADPADLSLAERLEVLAPAIARLTLDEHRDNEDRGRVYHGDLRLMFGPDYLRADLSTRMRLLLPGTFVEATNLPGLRQPSPGARGDGCGCGWISETLLAAAFRLGANSVIFVADGRDRFDAYLAAMWSYYNGGADPAGADGAPDAPRPRHSQVRAKYEDAWVELVYGPDAHGYFVVESPTLSRSRIHRALLT